MLKYLCSGAIFTTILASGLLSGQAAQAQAACGATSSVGAGTSVRCIVTAQPQALSCDAIPAAASHQMNLGAMNGVEVSVQSSGGNPTLLIDGPDGCFYALPNNGVAKIPGFWSNGVHRIYVGGGAGTTTLTIQAD
ncbi:MAG: hypothetical protein ACPGVO_10000 [Spirulinaceae cyanobacterium]